MILKIRYNLSRNVLCLTLPQEGNNQEKVLTDMNRQKVIEFLHKYPYTILADRSMEMTIPSIQIIIGDETYEVEANTVIVTRSVLHTMYDKFNIYY